MHETQGECLIRDEDAIRVMEEEGDSIAVFLMPGIQYYTGQLFNIPKLTKVAHSKGITVGADLAHAVGNVPLRLHEWGVDFAAWCTYKYMNSGPGGISAIFVHEMWTSSIDATVPALKGWWGNAMTSKFSMKEGSCVMFLLFLLLSSSFKLIVHPFCLISVTCPHFDASCLSLFDDLVKRLIFLFSFPDASIICHVRQPTQKSLQILKQLKEQTCGD